ncbi:MAG: serine/threonine protein kinase [Saccharothrix sp.]|nr:serine/threonine protein kinase [Saccharothrix sp.]
MTLLRAGQRIRDDYEVERLLGQGAFAEVYRVRHQYLGRRAMKVFKRIGKVEETKQMLDEALLLSQFEHPNIVRVFDASTVHTADGARGYFTMDYVAGGNLHDFWVSYRDRFVPVDVTVDILRQMCAGLAVAHAEDPPIIHRDVTPMNILVGYEHDGLRIRISDFGLAKRANPLTGLVSTRGNLAFKAPEALQNQQSDSTAGDVWAIGMIAYLLLTDRLPWEEAGGPASFFGIGHHVPPRSPRTLNYAVDQELEQVVLRMLELDPKERTPDARVAGEELDRWLTRHVHRRAGKDVRAARETSKTALGPPAPTRATDARALAEKALVLSRQAGTLAEAAETMEEAITKLPELLEEYGPKLRLWRKGIVN